jgi:sugar phosphate isomerase/epimerase
MHTRACCSLILAVTALAQNPPDRLPRVTWMRQGIIDAGGTHEPLIFLVRRGGMLVDRDEYNRQYRSEELLSRLKAQGVEVFHTSYYKGFGVAAEKEEMEETRRVAEMAHKLGFKVDTYIQWNTMMYETFFAEQPAAKDWVQRDASGRPIMLVYGHQQNYRYRPCFANREYLDYLKRIVHSAVTEVKTDFIHFDNFDLNPEPESCHCRHCTAGFRAFLRAKYTEARLKERFGFTNVDYVNPPEWNEPNPARALTIIEDPAQQEWIDYRCQQMTDALKEMALYARGLNPGVAIEINPHGITGGNRAWEAGLDHSRLLKWTDAFWSEEPNRPAWEKDGRLVSRIRSYKLARAYDNVLLAYTTLNELTAAEGLAFSQTIGWAGNDPLTDLTRRYIDFYRRNRDLFAGAKDLAPVAVLRSYPSITYHHRKAQLAAILTEQTLIQSRIPFRLIFDDQLGELSQVRTVILPDAECLSDVQIAALRRFVEQGGGLVATGAAGLFDEWRRARPRPGLAGLVEGQAAAERGARGRRDGVAETLRKEVGKGRTAYLREITFDGPLPAMEPHFTISNRFWKLPANARDLVTAIRWTMRDEMPVEIGGPPFLVANVTVQPEKRRTMVHLVNYNPKEGPLRQISLRFRQAAKSARMLTPDSESAQSLAVRTSGGSAEVTIPQMRVYSVIELIWQD